MTYARALQNSNFQTENIRNITLMGTEKQMEDNMRMIRADSQILRMNDLEIVRKSNNNYTIKSKDPAVVKKFQDHITSKGPSMIMIWLSVPKLSRNHLL